MRVNRIKFRNNQKQIMNENLSKLKVNEALKLALETTDINVIIELSKHPK